MGMIEFFTHHAKDKGLDFAPLKLMGALSLFSIDIGLRALNGNVMYKTVENQAQYVQADSVQAFLESLPYHCP